jgi:putative FmdB family regulatory protein
MPIYEYQCQACGYNFEEIQKVNDKPLCVCPQCKKSKVKRLISAANFHLKGGGWYKTDYQNKEVPAQKKQTQDQQEVAKKDSETTKKKTESKKETKDKN